MKDISVQGRIPFLLGGKHLNETILLEDFNTLCAPIINEATLPIKEAMEKAGINKGDIGLVLLAGGSSQLPGVSDKVYELTGVRPSTFPQNLLFAVAYGASLYHRRIFQLPSDKRDIRILGDNLGLLTRDGGYSGFKILIPHNAKLPTEATQSFPVSEGQEIVMIALHTDRGTGDNKSKPLRRKELRLLKQAKKISIKIKVDINRLITLDAFDPDNPNEKITIQVNRDELSESQINETRKKYGIVIEDIDNKLKNRLEHPCIGIDLGTTTSELAFTNRYGDPEPKCIENSNSDSTYDSHCYPSIVFFSNNLRNPDVCNSNAKNAIESGFDNAFSSFKIKDRSKPLGEISGVPITVSALSAHVLAKIWNDAKKGILGNVTELRSAVITVPAAFSPDDCQDTYNSAKLAGITDITLIDEPTAAFLYYQTLYPNVSNSEIKTILVFDFGGGTADVAILDVSDDPGVLPGTYKDSLFHILSTSGNSDCGGKHIDEKLASFLKMKFEESHGVSLDNETGALSRLKNEAERIKIELSNKAAGEE